MRMLGTRKRLRITRNSSTAARCRPITFSIARADSTIHAGADGKPAESHNSSATTDSAQAKRMRRRSAGASHHNTIEPPNSPSRVQPNSGYTAPLYNENSPYVESVSLFAAGFRPVGADPGPSYRDGAAGCGRGSARQDYTVLPGSRGQETDPAGRPVCRRGH